MIKFYFPTLLIVISVAATAQNVGIGTTNPLEKLHIDGAVRGNQAGALRISTGTGYLDLGPKNATWSHLETDRPRFYFNKGITVDEGLIGSYDEDLQLQTSGTTRMRILNSNGNVGIGVSPTYKLHVLGGSATGISAYTDGYVRDMSGRLARNLISSHVWNIGSGTIGHFTQNGATAENTREWGDGPHGQRAILWKCAPDGDNGADGGWNSALFEIDHTKTYRVSIWVKRTGTLDGTTYLGVEGSNINHLDGTPQTNPYFFCGDLPEFDKWYLIVGYIHGSGDPSTVHKGAIYDGITGQKVISLNGGSNCSTDFKFSTSATSQRQRAYFYYNSNTTNRQFFWDPRFEEVNGSEPTIEALLGSAGSSVGFSGTTNYVSKFTSPSTIGNSQIFDNGTNVGIGTASPAQKLDVNGRIRLVSSQTELYQNTNRLVIRSEDTDNVAQFANYGIFLPQTGQSYNLYVAKSLQLGYSESNPVISYRNGGLLFSADATERMRLTSAGNLGIGNNNPIHKLQVAGSASVYDDAQNTDSRYFGEVIEKGWTASIGSVTYAQISDAPVGNIVARANAYTWVYGPRVALDRTKDYIVEGWVRYTSGTPATWYFNVQNFDASGNNISGDGTDWHYPVSGAVPPNTWQKFSFIVGPNGVKNHNANAKFISVGWIANYTTGNANYEFCGWKIKPINTVSGGNQSFATNSSTSETTLLGNNTGTYSGSDAAGWTIGTWQSTGFSVTKNITSGNFVNVTLTARVEGDNLNRCPPSVAYFRIMRGTTEIGRTATNIRSTSTNPSGFYLFTSANLSMSFVDSGVSGNQTYTLEYWLTNDNNNCSVESVQLGERYINVIEHKQ